MLQKSDTKPKTDFSPPFYVLQYFFIICYFRMFPTQIKAVEKAGAVQTENQLFAKEVLTILPLKFYIF